MISSESGHCFFFESRMGRSQLLPLGHVDPSEERAFQVERTTQESQHGQETAKTLV